MDKIKFVNGKEGNTPITADKLNQMQTNVENAISKTETDIEKTITENIEDTKKYVDNRCFHCNSYLLTYLDANTLSTTITLNGFKDIRDKAMVLLTCVAMTDTPYKNITNLAYTNTANDITINAIGSGFVNGHIVEVKVMVYYFG